MYRAEINYDTWEHPDFVQANDQNFIIEIRFYPSSGRVRCFFNHYSAVELPEVKLKHALYGKTHSVEVPIFSAARYLQNFLDTKESIVLLTDPSRPLREFAKLLFKEKHLCIM